MSASVSRVGQVVLDDQDLRARCASRRMLARAARCPERGAQRRCATSARPVRRERAAVYVSSSSVCLTHVHLRPVSCLSIVYVVSGRYARRRPRAMSATPDAAPLRSRAEAEGRRVSPSPSPLRWVRCRRPSPCPCTESPATRESRVQRATGRCPDANRPLIDVPPCSGFSPRVVGMSTFRALALTRNGDSKLICLALHVDEVCRMCCAKGATLTSKSAKYVATLPQRPIRGMARHVLDHAVRTEWSAVPSRCSSPRARVRPM